MNNKKIAGELIKLAKGLVAEVPFSKDFKSALTELIKTSDGVDVSDDDIKLVSTGNSESDIFDFERNIKVVVSHKDVKTFDLFILCDLSKPKIITKYELKRGNIRIVEDSYAAFIKSVENG